MKILVIIFLAVVAAQALSDQEEWAQFKVQHKKNYVNYVEEQKRFEIFQVNLRKIEHHNEKYNKGLSTYEMGVTKFADLTDNEFMSSLTLFSEPIPDSIVHTLPQVSDLPSEFDWRQKGAVTEVKDQGTCGSCWSFSTTGTVEGAYFLKTGNLISLSEQNLVDCASDLCNGCSGGWMYKALEYIRKAGGIMSEKDYPYEGVDDQCRFNVSNVAAKISGFTYIKKGDEDDLKNAVYVKGPVSVAIMVTPNFSRYKSGIFDDDACITDYVNHGVLVVGYGTQNGKDYWIVKNSWGDQFGNNGYIWMTRNKNNQCNIASFATYPNI